MNFKKIATRCYSDYLMPSRLDVYENLIIQAKAAGYKNLTVRDAWRNLEKNNTFENIFVHRHDIDTDLNTAKRIFDIERRHGVVSTFYFRLSTLDFKFMREIEECGGEASYHYEELATYAKKHHIKSPDRVLEKLDEIRDDFFKNIKNIRVKTGLSCSTVASHGDFANRRLGLINHIVLQNIDFRKKCGIILESYDDALIGNFNFRISDKPFPHFWQPISPFDVIKEKNSNIFLLTHPRQWQSSFIANTRENFARIYEELRW